MTLFRPQPITCILNARADSSRALQARKHLPDLFRSHGVEARIRLARNGSEIGSLARRAAKERAAVVVAGGGDGTMNCVAGALVGSDTPLGILPLGTLNHFAKDLGIPLDLEGAVTAVCSGQFTRIDVGEVNGRIFLNNSSLGIYPWIVREREKEEGKSYSKWGAFGWAAMSVLRRYPLLRVRLRADNLDEAEVATPFVFIGNNRYEATGLRIGARQVLDSGQLWVCRAPPVGRSRLLLLAMQHLFGVQRDDLAIFEAREVRIRTEAARVPVATDGEVIFMQSPLHYHNRSRALAVMAPAADGNKLST